MEDVFESENLFEAPKQSFLTVGGITRNCIKLLPLAKSNPQEIVIGDSRGIIYITSYEDNEPKIILKTEPYVKEITCMQINPLGIIYFSVGNSIYSIDRECRDKFKIEFNIASDIQQFEIIENKIWTVTDNFLNKFQFGEVTNEIFTFDNGSKISSIFVTKIMGEETTLLLIGCEDEKIKINENEETLKTIPVKGSVSCFCLGKLTDLDNSDNNIYFGTSIGGIGCVYVDSQSSNSKLLFENSNNRKQEPEVIDLKVFDINFDNKNELILIRSNGIVEIYTITDSYKNIHLICKYSTHEHLTGLTIGKYKDREHFEIILSSLSGLVFSLTPELDSYKKMKNIDAKTLSRNIVKEKMEVEELKKRLADKKLEFEKSKSKQYNPTVKNIFKIDYKFSLLQKDSVFKLIIDSEFPMEMVVIHCVNTKLDILKIETEEVLMNILDEETKDEETKKHSKFLATFSLKDANHRLELIVRTYEGIKDDINITIIPYNKPKTAQIIHIPVYALSFHKLYEPNYDCEIGQVVGCDDEKTTNILTIEKMKASEINQILHLIIPNIPDNLKDDTAKYELRSTFLNTLVKINIEEEKCEIKAPFISTIMTLKKQIAKEAGKRRKEMQTRIKFREMSINKILEILNPKIQEIFDLEKQYKIIQAFKELGNSIALNDLPEDYINILNKADDINKKYSNRGLNLNYYKCLIEQLFLDVKELRNPPVNKIDEIKLLMEDYSFEKMKNIFKFLYD